MDVRAEALELSAEGIGNGTPGVPGPTGSGVQKPDDTSRRCSRTLGTTLFPFHIGPVHYERKTKDNIELTWPRHHVGPVQLPIPVSQT